MARDLLRQVALSAGATWWIGVDGRVNILDHSKPVSSDSQPVVVNSRTGMIGSAHQSDQGVVVRILINAAVTIGTAIKIDESSIVLAERDNNIAPSSGQIEKNTAIDNTGRISADGIYRVVFMDINGGTRSQPWYMDCTCLGTGASFTGGQAGSYDGPPLDTGFY